MNKQNGFNSIKSMCITILLLQIMYIYPIFSQNVNTFDIQEATIDSVHHAIDTHQITCEQLILDYINRIKKYNLSIGVKPPINAFTEINPSALNDARFLDDEYKKTNKFAGPLHCVTVIIKDNIDSFDMTTTSGSFSLLGNQPVKDAFLVKKLREAGAVIIGKGGMDEFASGLFGISSRSGRIGNAYDPAKNPGGSSGGPAAGVSANFALVGIGTDNNGSVRIPAAFNGLVGLRPSTGLISQEGIFPMGNLDGIAGPLTRTTKDLAIVLDVISKPDSTDNKTVGVVRPKSYSFYMDEHGLAGKRIGIVHQVNEINTYAKMPEDIHRTLQTALQKMQDLGAITVDIDLPNFDNNRKHNQAGEIDDVNAYLASFPATRKNFQDICESNRTRSFGSIKECLKFTNSIDHKHSRAYQGVLNIFKKNKKYVQSIMSTNHLDALFIPISTHGSATYDALTINTWRAPVSSNSGLPSIAMNIGYTHVDNMPIGIELVGKEFDEGTLIAISFAYESHSPARIVPPLPDANQVLVNYSIPQINNILNIIGKSSYDKVILTANPGADLANILTPDIFKKIVTQQWELQKRTKHD